VQLPIQAYPLLENAIRAARGWTLEEHRNAIGELWAIGSAVASSNPYAWIREPLTAEAIMTPSPSNRMVSFPYTKYTVANLSVDQGAAYILCSVEAARAAGVSEDRFVFPLAGADGNDHWFLSHRENLHSSPAIRLAGEATFAAAEVVADELAFVDLYSCFPAVVQIAIDELGLGNHPERPWTTTGGLVFAGGPGNNYVTHSIASMVDKLRSQPGASGLVTGLGWFSTKHSVGIFGSRPPRHQGADGYRWTDVQAAVDASPQTRVDSNYVGTCTVETSTVTFDRTGEPEHGIVVARTPDNARVWGQVTHADHLRGLLESDPNGRSGSLAADGTFTLA
jgi:acetyl-CoA C-acetyltransferase